MLCERGPTCLSMQCAGQDVIVLLAIRWNEERRGIVLLMLIRGVIAGESDDFGCELRRVVRHDLVNPLK